MTLSVVDDPGDFGDQLLDGASLIGFTEPRISTPLLGGLSRVDEVVDLARRISLPLLPWQVWLLTDALAVDEKNRFRKNMVATIIARQNGKTFLATIRILAGLFCFDEDHIIAMSQNRELTINTFQKVRSIIERTPWMNSQVKKIREANGQERIELNRGAVYRIVAATDKGPRGWDAVDLFYADETRELTSAAWDAAAYTLQTRPYAQLWTTSNAGDARSEVLNALRDNALSNPDPSFGWYEWSAPPDLKITDRTAWQYANPSLGRLIHEKTLAAHVATDKPDTVRTEMLCQWVSNLENPFPSGAWEECFQSDLALIPGAPTFLAVDISTSRRFACLVGAQIMDDGRIGVGLIETWESEHSIDDLKVAGSIAEWAKRYKVAAIAYDRFAANTVAARLNNGGIRTIDLVPEFSQACDDLLFSMTHKRLAHSGQPILDTHVNGCAAKPTRDGGWRIVRRGSSGDISAAVALAMVVHQANQPQSSPVIISA